MQGPPVSPAYRILRAIGSLWFAAVLLVLVLLALASATVYESMRSTEHALSVYYRAPWFTFLLALLAINVLVAIILRFPFSKWRIGFVITHGAILLILGGALVTRYYAEDGQLALAEGQSSDRFVLRGHETLTVLNRQNGKRTVLDLDPALIGGLNAHAAPAMAAISVGEVTIHVEQYVPDSEVVEQVRDDNPLLRPAVQLSIAAGQETEPIWVFPNQRASSGSIPVSLKIVDSAEELSKLLNPPMDTGNAPQGRVRVEYQGQIVERRVDECLTLPIAVGDTGLSFRVLRFMPHATVGANNKISNTSNNPINPAIEVEIASAAGVETRLAFAKYPGFASMHTADGITGLTVTHVFDAGASPPATPVEILRGPEGDLHVRFAGSDGVVSATSVEVGATVKTPWSGRRLVVHRSLNHARFEQSLQPVEPPRKNRSAGLEVRMVTANSSGTVWLQKNRPYPITVDQTPYELSYGSKTVHLGFSLKLDSFSVGYYPGEQRPRSFESRVSITDASTGRSLSRLISMNHPTDYGRYTFFQSSYQLDGTKRVSILSVSRDPGTMIVFAGYVLMIGGMIVVLFTRQRQRQLAELSTATGVVSAGTGGLRVDLLHTEERCAGGSILGGGELSSPQRRTDMPKATTPLKRNKAGANSR